MSFYPKLKFEQDFDSKVSRKTLLYVGVIHLVCLLALYISGIIQNFFWNMAPQSIAVNLTSSSAFQEMRTAAVATAQKNQVQQPKKQLTKIKQKEPKTVQKVPTKKAWKPLDITKITKPSETQVKEFKPIQQTTATELIQSVNASTIAANLKKSLNSVKFGPVGGAGSAKVNPAILTYYDSISSFLYERWEQPSKLALSGDPPHVLVRLNIGSDGKLINYNIMQSSTFPEMNTSVKQMLATIDRLPQPPSGAMTIEATLILTN